MLRETGGLPVGGGLKRACPVVRGSGGGRGFPARDGGCMEGTGAGRGSYCCCLVAESCPTLCMYCSPQDPLSLRFPR